jgi:hypothetical protein
MRIRRPAASGPRLASHTPESDGGRILAVIHSDVADLALAILAITTARAFRSQGGRSTLGTSGQNSLLTSMPVRISYFGGSARG